MRAKVLMPGTLIESNFNILKNKGVLAMDMDRVRGQYGLCHWALFDKKWFYTCLFTYAQLLIKEQITVISCLQKCIK